MDFFNTLTKYISCPNNSRSISLNFFSLSIERFDQRGAEEKTCELYKMMRKYIL